jgi:DNA-directed RNA polymerase
VQFAVLRTGSEAPNAGKLWMVASNETLTWVLSESKPVFGSTLAMVTKPSSWLKSRYLPSGE